MDSNEDKLSFKDIGIKVGFYSSLFIFSFLSFLLLYVGVKYSYFSPIILFNSENILKLTFFLLVSLFILFTTVGFLSAPFLIIGVILLILFPSLYKHPILFLIILGTLTGLIRWVRN